MKHLPRTFVLVFALSLFCTSAIYTSGFAQHGGHGGGHDSTGTSHGGGGSNGGGGSSGGSHGGKDTSTVQHHDSTSTSHDSTSTHGHQDSTISSHDSTSHGHSGDSTISSHDSTDHHGQDSTSHSHDSTIDGRHHGDSTRVIHSEDTSRIRSLHDSTGHTDIGQDLGRGRGRGRGDSSNVHEALDSLRDTGGRDGSMVKTDPTFLERAGRQSQGIITNAELGSAIADEIPKPIGPGVTTNTVSDCRLGQNPQRRMSGENQLLAYSLKAAVPVSIRVFDQNGTMISSMTNEVTEPGSHTATLATHELPTGAYIVQIVAGAEMHTVRLMVIQ